LAFLRANKKSEELFMHVTRDLFDASKLVLVMIGGAVGGVTKKKFKFDLLREE